MCTRTRLFYWFSGLILYTIINVAYSIYNIGNIYLIQSDGDFDIKLKYYSFIIVLFCLISCVSRMTFFGICTILYVIIQNIEYALAQYLLVFTSYSIQYATAIPIYNYYTFSCTHVHIRIELYLSISDISIINISSV